MIVTVVADMYAVCAIRYVSRQMGPVEACDSAEGFVFEEGPATNSVYFIHYYCCLQILVWQIRNSGYTCLSSLRTLTRLAFVPAALIVPFSLKSEAGVLLHS